VAQEPGRGPFGESDLAYQFGRHPLNVAGRNRPTGEGRCGAVERCQASMEELECRAIVSGADLAGVAQLVSIVMSHQKGTQTLARSLRRSVAADNELLTADALDLEPVGRSCAHVAGIRPLGDDAFRFLGAGLLEHGVNRIGSAYSTASSSTALRSRSGNRVRWSPS